MPPQQRRVKAIVNDVRLSVFLRTLSQMKIKFFFFFLRRFVGSGLSDNGEWMKICFIFVSVPLKAPAGNRLLWP